MSTSPSLRVAYSEELISLAALVAVSVQQCPAVASLSAGRFGQFSTYLAGQRVVGVGVDDDRIDIGVVARFGIPISDLSGQVRAAVVPLAGGRSINIQVDDVQVPGDAEIELGAAPIPRAD